MQPLLPDPGKMTPSKIGNTSTHVRLCFVGLLPALILMTLVAAACGGDTADQEPFDPQSSALGTIEISSPAFGRGDSIPVEFTCDGDDLSPPLRWSEPPAGTRALAIIVDDPDAPGRIFRHWSVYNIPSGTRSLKESRPTAVKKSSWASAQPATGGNPG